MFISREKELSYLNEVYQKPGVGMTVIYGHRRIGKSTLISEVKWFDTLQDEKIVLVSLKEMGFFAHDMQQFPKFTLCSAVAFLRDVIHTMSTRQKRYRVKSLSANISSSARLDIIVLSKSDTVSNEI